MSTMNKIGSLPIGLLLATWLVPGINMAQSGEEYYFNGIYNPTLADVNKIALQPHTYDSILPEKTMEYRLLTVKSDVPARVDSISAARLNIQLAQEKLYKGYVKAGFGLYTTPLAELYFDQTRARNNGYGIHFRHMSSNGGVGDRGPSHYSFNNLDGFYKAILPKHVVEGRLNYDRRRVSYYGYQPSDSLNALMDAVKPPDDAIKQVYNSIGFAVRLKSLYKDSTKLAHDVGLAVNHLTNLTKSSELNVTMDAQLALRQDDLTYGAEVRVDNNVYRGVRDSLPDLRQNGTLVGIAPHVTSSNGKYTAKVGAGIYVDAMGKTSVHFFPQAYAHYRLFDDILVPYIGLDGQRKRNGLRSLSHENPFITGAPWLENSSVLYDLYGGLRGSLSRDLGFDVRISKVRIKNRPLYLAREHAVQNVGYGDQFMVVYDRVDELDIGGELRYSHQEHIDVYGGIHVFNYATRTQAEAWNLPSYTLNLGAVYDFQDKLLLKVEAELLGQRKMPRTVPATWNDLSPQPLTKDAKGLLDLYLGIEYRYTKRLSVFLDFSNLSASKYERWYNYPTQRTLVLGGATFAF